MNNVRHSHQLFRNNGNRATRQRRFILHAIENMSGQFTPQELHSLLQRTHPEIGLVTVYRTLKLLSEKNLLCTMGQNGRSQSYVRRPSCSSAQQHHHHLVCTRCKMVVDITSCGLESMEQKLAAATGFTISEHRLEFMGLCCQCQGENK